MIGSVLCDEQAARCFSQVLQQSDSGCLDRAFGSLSTSFPSDLRNRVEFDLPTRRPIYSETFRYLAYPILHRLTATG
jgi:hypothetical protein